MIHYSVHQKNKDLKPTILKLLKEVEDDFIPALSLWLNLEDYAEKLANNAVCWIVHEDNQEVGFAACYVNEAPLYSFWTMLAIKKEFRNRLIALQIEPKIIEYCKIVGSLGIQAEVDSSNVNLIKLHQYFGFELIGQPRVKGERSIVDLQLTF